MKWGNEFRGRPGTSLGTKRQQPVVGWFTRPQLVPAESSDIFHPVTNPPALYQHERQSGVNPCGVCHVRVSPLTPLTVLLSFSRPVFPPLSPSRPVPFFLFPTILGVVPRSTFQQRSGVLATLPWQHSHGSPTYFFPPLPLLLPSCHANFLFLSLPDSPRNSWNV